VQGLLEGKVAIITGAGAGVGRAATLLFAQHGAKVLALDVLEDAVAESARLACEAGGSAISARCDVTSAEQVEASVARAVDEFGRLDVMYNNVGVATKVPEGGGASSFVTGSYEELMRIMAINAGGVANGCRAAIKQFLAQGSGGAIVNTSSVAGIVAFGGADYGATKGAVSIMTRALAMEVAKHGIRVNAVCPAAMPTNFGHGAAAWSEGAKELVANLHPLGKVITPEDCAQGALFLASDLASNVTGVNLPVDGGLSTGVKM
jgi:NAD(P)-dependent dehydrogenase (short-subunit alcohol dehydrogenase family)